MTDHREKWKAANPDKHRESQRRYRENNKERRAEYLCDWRQANPEKTKAAKQREVARRCREKHAARERKYRWASFGVTPAQVEELFIQQNRRCAACSSETPNHKHGWAVDHCHSRLKIRGILCQPCNIALGLVQDSENRLRALADYVARHKGSEAAK